MHGLAAQDTSGAVAFPRHRPTLSARNAPATNAPFETVPELQASSPKRDKSASAGLPGRPYDSTEKGSVCVCVCVCVCHHQNYHAHEKLLAEQHD
jgi:hypothetical protein